MIEFIYNHKNASSSSNQNSKKEPNAYGEFSDEDAANEDDEVYVEACLGLGEALVSDMPGKAFSFSYHKKNKADCRY